ncbi:MAG: LCP family protein [Rubrobacter sp.]
MAVVVLFGLVLGIGTQAGLWFDGSDAEAVRSAEVSPRSVEEPSETPDEFVKTPVQVARDPGFEKSDPAREEEPAHEASDGSEEEGQPQSPTGILNVLVLGVDRRPSAGEVEASRSDTMMLVRVAPQTGSIKLLSVPRDLLVEVEPGVKDRINMAYSNGGVEQAKAVMEDFTGVSIDRHAIVDFGGFEDVVNALGGITVDVGQPIQIGIEGRRVYIPPGKQELNGLEALAYARFRGTPCGDLDRIERQQRLVAALRDQAFGWNVITKLPRIVTVANQNVDTDLGIVQAISVGRALVGRGEKGALRSSQLKGTPEKLPNGDEVLVPDEQANEKILETFRDDGPKVRPPDRAPRPEASSSGC